MIKFQEYLRISGGDYHRVHLLIIRLDMQYSILAQ